jgi:hypothetical protein
MLRRYLMPCLQAGAVLLLTTTVVWAQGELPNTPAGHALSTWLTAFNSGDRAAIESFIKSQASWLNLDSMMSWRAEVGGYDVVAVYPSDRNDVVVRLRAKASPTEEIGRVTVTATDPALVTELGTFIFPSGATYLGFQLDGATRTAVINTSVAKLTEHYVLPEAGKTMALVIAKRAKQGAYAKADGEHLAKLLTADMLEVSRDKHLLVVFRPYRLPAKSPDRPGGSAQPEGKDCAFDKVERLPNNIGYLKFDGFVASDACADIRIAAMTFLAGVDALIMDLRDNRGGGGSDKGPDLLSYLFDLPTHFADVFDRTTGRTTQSWIQPTVPDKRLGPIPLYVLTSRVTFSAAEYYAYNLQALKRATIVGEVTGGGSHQTSTERIDDRFDIRVPFAREISPITKTDWEGVGVVPDVKVQASEALAAAEKLASDELRKRPK